MHLGADDSIRSRIYWEHPALPEPSLILRLHHLYDDDLHRAFPIASLLGGHPGVPLPPRLVEDAVTVEEIKRGQPPGQLQRPQLKVPSTHEARLSDVEGSLSVRNKGPWLAVPSADLRPHVLTIAIGGLVPPFDPHLTGDGPTVWILVGVAGEPPCAVCRLDAAHRLQGSL